MTVLYKLRIGQAVEADTKTLWILATCFLVAINVLIDQVLAASFGDVGVQGCLLWLMNPVWHIKRPLWVSLILLHNPVNEDKD